MSEKSKKIIFLVVLVILVTIAGVYIFIVSKQNNIQVATPAVSQQMGAVIPGFPDFPMYPNVKIESSQKTDAYGTQPVSYQAYLESQDTATNVILWYSDNLQKSGWTIDRAADDSQPNDQNIVVKKGNSTATINAEFEDGKTGISIYIQ